MIVCIGDSITAGQHVNTAWPQLLNHGEVVRAAGVPGDTTRLGLERFPRDVQEHEPEVVVIQFGHNDANRWQTDRGLPRVSPEAFAANLTEMIARSRAFGAAPYLCTLTPSRRSAAHAFDSLAYDGLVREVARRTGVPLIDVAAAFDGRAGLLLADGLHLSPEGHRVYAETVMRVLG